MGRENYDITISAAANVTVTAVMCSAPTYAVSAVRMLAQPVFKSAAVINGVNYSPGQPLISASGGTVTATAPLNVTGSTTAAATSVTINGTYSLATTAATFIVPFGTTFNSATKEYEVGGSPRNYTYTASFIATAGGVTSVAETIIAGNVYMTIENAPRVPAAGTSSNKACSCTQV